MGGVGLEPAALLGDADFDHVVLLAVDGFEDGVGGAERDFVLAALAAEEDADAEFLLHVVVSLAHTAAGDQTSATRHPFRYGVELHLVAAATKLKQVLRRVCGVRFRGRCSGCGGSR